LKEADRPLVDWLLALQESLPDRLNRMLPREIDGLNIRHHGDLHLGQLLIVKDDIFIIDFEGEPRRTIAERRRKAPAARDVAGLIRSIDYSATAAYERALRVGSDDQNRLAAALAEWRDRAVDAFLASYRETTANQRFWPAGPAAADQILNFFLLEKALRPRCATSEHEAWSLHACWRAAACSSPQAMSPRSVCWMSPARASTGS
jgi:maltose alpha-D-glucosyltransferase/alpha-amylase